MFNIILLLFLMWTILGILFVKQTNDSKIQKMSLTERRYFFFMAGPFAWIIGIFSFFR